MALTTHSPQAEPTAVRCAVGSEAVVMIVAGPASASTLAEVCDVLDRLSDRSIIVDLSDLSFSDLAVVGDLVSVLQLGHKEDDCCVVARQQSSRSTLRRVSGRRLAVFQTVADATQAHVLASCGYGPGWCCSTANAED